MSQDKPLFEVEVQPLTPEEIERERVREEYRAKLAEKLKDPEFRKIEGFPIGTDEAILALSDPPYYTACPNPFVEERLREHGKPFDSDTDDYHREPFAADVSEGKNHPIYNAHSYHTKVPHRAIMRYILHYTEPGDVVYDGFCGTGMTSVAAQLCGDRSEVEALGYHVDGDGFVWEKEPWETKQALEAGKTNPHSHMSEPKPFSKFGVRVAMINDLSPAATFIAYNYNTPADAVDLERRGKVALARVEEECSWMYSTLHREPNKWSDEAWGQLVQRLANGLESQVSLEDLRSYVSSLHTIVRLGRISYAIWSDVISCPHCDAQFNLWNASVVVEEGRISDPFQCPHCGAELSKARCGRAFTTVNDLHRSSSVRQAVSECVRIAYTCGRTKGTKSADVFDDKLARVIGRLKGDNWVPTDELPDGYNLRQPKRSHGLTHSHHFYTSRNLDVLASFWAKCSSELNLKWLVTGAAQRASKQHQIAITRVGGPKAGIGGATGGHKRGTLYVPSFQVEVDALKLLEDRIRIYAKAAQFSRKTSAFILSTHSTTVPMAPANSVDYINVDPPFGANPMYSELSYLWESWLRVFTNNSSEAIENAVQKKALPDYQQLMQRCFQTCFDLLKPGRWMTVEFHNSENAVWNSIQEALDRVGFVVADVRILDKQIRTQLQRVTASATKQDLVITCYKPKASFIEQFEEDKGTVKGAREFVEQHLEMLPVAPTTIAGTIESLAERTLSVLYDRMIGYHLVNGARIPLSASEFRVLLEEVCYERDSMYFLPKQVVRYDALKSRGFEVEQLSIFVRDEKTAVQWAQNELAASPQTLGELAPKFMQASKDWGQHEVMPELRDLLQQYFIRESDETWVVPDPDNERHLEEIRKKSMLREFQEYIRRSGQLKTFRTEALLAGFAHCWETKQYDVIVGVCEKIPAKTLQEIQDLVMFYDIAKERAPEKVAQFEFKWE